MVNLEKIREVMAEHLEEDQSRVFIVATATTLEKALSDAAVQLGISVRDIDYEILQRGTTSFLSLNKREWIIRAYENKKKKAKAGGSKTEKSEESEDLFVLPGIENANGDAFVFLASDGVYVKVIPPRGDGTPATLKDALDKLRERNVTGINEDVLRPKIVKLLRSTIH